MNDAKGVEINVGDTVWHRGWHRLCPLSVEVEGGKPVPVDPFPIGRVTTLLSSTVITNGAYTRGLIPVYLPSNLVVADAKATVASVSDSLPKLR